MNAADTSIDCQAAIYNIFIYGFRYSLSPELQGSERLVKVTSCSVKNSNKRGGFAQDYSNTMHPLLLAKLVKSKDW